MDILIIGNGFDLAHGLKTSYKDFLEFCLNIDKVDHEADPCFKKCCETNLWMKHFITKQNELGNKWIDLENEIFDVILRLRLHPIRQPKVLSLDMTDINFNFFDIKLRDVVYGEKLSKEGYIDPVHPHYIMFYLNNNYDFINLLNMHLQEFTRIFAKYLIKIVLPNVNSKLAYGMPLQTPYILSFNYTDTFERLYKKDNDHTLITPRFVYIHGKVNDNGNCNLVLGTHSFDNNNPNNSRFDIPIEYNVFKKHNQRHKYNTIEPYQDFIKGITNPHKIITPTFHIVGHSLDKTDHKILRHILKIKENATINVYFHSIEEEERLINNITEILGEDDVLKRVRFIHLHDDKRSILKRIKKQQIVSSIQT